MFYSRRDFIKIAALSSGTTLITSCGVQSNNPPTLDPLGAGQTDLPVEIISPDSHNSTAYFGPNPHAIHPQLWARPTSQNDSVSHGSSLPKPTSTVEHHGPVIIGGGLSGLVSAFALKEKNPIVLEASHRLGGNSQGQVWSGIPYSLGAAYFIQPEEGSDIHRILFELGLLREIKNPKGGDEYAEAGAIHHGLWRGGRSVYGNLAPHVQKLRTYLRQMLGEENGLLYPDLPTEDSSLRNYINRLDDENFSDHLLRIAGHRLPAPLAIAIEQYCWSAFAASGTEISAAAGLNFLCSEFDSIAVLPGGNSRVTQRICEELRSRLGHTALRTQKITINVKVNQNKVEILYFDASSGETCLLRAPCAIIACPKFVAKRIVDGCSPLQYEAMNAVKYRAYLTANILIKRPVALSFYDLFLLKRASNENPFPPNATLTEIGATDAILANWATPHPNYSVLTLYRALPFDGGRALLYADESFRAARECFERQVTTELLPLFHVDSDMIQDIRVTRWGHALPVAAKGFYKKELPEKLKAPVQGRVFFAQQDNWALPAFEVAFTEGLSAAAAAKSLLEFANA